MSGNSALIHCGIKSISSIPEAHHYRVIVYFFSVGTRLEPPLSASVVASHLLKEATIVEHLYLPCSTIM